MSTNTSEAARSALTFCQEYVELAGDLAGIGKAFLVAALVLGIAFAIVETIRKYREPAAPRSRAAPNTGAIKEVVEALKGFLEALSKAPAWIAMFGVGVLLFWMAGFAIPEKCLPEINKAYAGGSADRAGQERPGNDQGPGNSVANTSENVSTGNGSRAQ